MIVVPLENRLFIQYTGLLLSSHPPPQRKENPVSIAVPKCIRADAMHSHGNTTMGTQPVKLTYTKAERDLCREVQTRVFAKCA